MLKHVIIKELRDIIASTKFAVTFGACALLILLAFGMGAKSYHMFVAQEEAARAENLKQMEGLTDWLQVRQHRIFLPPQPLATIVSGVENDIGSTIEVQGRGELTPVNSRFSADPLSAVFRILDLGFLFQVVLTLFAILFGYDAVNGERERGTLQLTFANPIPRATFITGKFLGALIGLGVPLLLALLLGAAVLPAMGVHLTGEQWGRLALIVVGGLLLFAATLASSIALSAMTRRSSHSFLLSLLLWVFAVLIIPRSAVLLAGRAVDVPSVDALNAKKAAFQRQLWAEDRSTMSGFKPSSTGDPGKMVMEFQKTMSTIADEREKKMAEYSRTLNEERTNKQVVQERLAFGLARISPLASFTLLATRLAGTSLELKDHFLQAAKDYQISYGRFMLEKTGMNPGGSMVVFRMVEDGNTPKKIDPHELPAFHYVPQTFAELAPGTVVDFGILAGWTLLAFGIGFAAFQRYDVR